MKIWGNTIDEGDCSALNAALTVVQDRLDAPDYGPCEYCDKPVVHWHSIGSAVCERHALFSRDEILDLEPIERKL